MAQNPLRSLAVPLGQPAPFSPPQWIKMHITKIYYLNPFPHTHTHSQGKGWGSPHGSVCVCVGGGCIRKELPRSPPLMVSEPQVLIL